MQSNITLIDSDKFHENQTEELKYQLQKIKPIIINILQQKQIYYFFIWYYLLTVFNQYNLAKLFVIISGFLIIFLNLGKREKGTMSAYSIFNKGCQQILGDTDINQLDSQLRNRNYNKNNSNQNYDIQDDNVKLMKAFYDKMPLSKKSNMACYCGSDKKYKKCCYWNELKEKEEEEIMKRKEYKEEYFKQK